MIQSYFYFKSLLYISSFLLSSSAVAMGTATGSKTGAATGPKGNPPPIPTNRFERILSDQHSNSTWDCSHALKGDITGDDIDDLICSGQNATKKLIIGMIFGPLEASEKTAVYDGEVTQCVESPCSLAFEEYNPFGDMEKTCRRDPKDEGCAELIAIETYYKNLGRPYPHGIAMNRGKLEPYHVIWDPVAKRFRAWTL